MSPRCFVTLVLLASCSTPHVSHRPRGEAPSADRSNPRRLEVQKEWDVNHLDVLAPAAGTWWFVVSSPPGDLEINTFYSGEPGSVALALGDEPAGSEETSSTGSHGTKLALPSTGADILVRVTTTTKARFNLSAYFHSAPIVDEPRTPDAAIVDAQVFPKCEPNKPDFKNPNCCQAACGLGRRGCSGMVISLDPQGRSAVIPLGAADEIMAYANGYLSQGRNAVSAIVVLMVKEHESLVQILSPKSVDPSNVATTHVTLMPPDSCLH